MDQKYIFLTVLMHISLAQGAENFCVPLVKMQHGNNEELAVESNCVTKEYVDALVKELYINISSVIVANNGNCGPTGNYYATKQDIETLKTLYGNVIAVLGREHSCQNSSEIDTSSIKPRDCQEIKNEGNKMTGSYTVYPDPGTSGVSVRCDMDTTSGGWTVIQRRISDSDFYKTWSEYENGFGNLSSNFWLGNRYIYMITKQGKYGLRVDLTSMEGETAYAEYREFSVGDAESSYKLHVQGYSGTAGDSFTSRGNGRKFSTYDKDNDVYGGNCAEKYHGAWWYDACHTSNLNGDYGNTQYAKGPVWRPWKGYYSPMKITEMKIRPMG